MSSKRPEHDEDNEEVDDEELEEDEDFDGSETVVMSGDDDDDDDDDDALDVSMEVNVEKLMAEMDKTKSDDVARKKEIRRRLEEIQESRSLEDTYSFDLYGED
ncbi:MAG: hypothetical protein U5K76_03575 [Woeseiaceae bacterium]|nr:hypothetical protein [Woeseiaceae bacterium]